MYANSSVQSFSLQEMPAISEKVHSFVKWVFTEKRITEITLVAFNLAIAGLVFASLYQAIENDTVTAY